MQVNVKVKLKRQSNANFYNVSLGTVVEIDIEDYTTGVVASEVGNAPMEACCAQAIAARTIAYKAYTKGTSISDLSTECQAFRTERMNNKTYSNAIEAVKRTAGMVLFYNGKVLESCPYSASNGGQTVSSQERWGGYRAYLVSKPDPWDGSVKKSGHGVGMSQLGAKNAANQGKTYKEILAFYYPSTEIKEVNTVATVTTTNNKVNKIIDWAESMVGTGYIYGATGWICTPERRQQQANQYPEYADTIMTTGAKWDGKICHDCAQFTRKAMAQAGITLPSGATSQWKSSVWEKKGTAADIDSSKMCLLFRESNGKMQHVLLYCGNGYVIDARGTANGVMKSKLGTYKYTHWAIPKGLYSETSTSTSTPSSTPAPTEPTPIHETLRVGATGQEVEACKEYLIMLGYLDAYSVYGDNTIAAVKKFQADNGLEADGVCGTSTWAKLEEIGATTSNIATVVAQSGSTVNLRKEPSTSAARLAKVPLNMRVEVVAKDDTWCQVKYNNLIGYMMTEYLQFG